MAENMKNTYGAEKNVKKSKKKPIIIIVVILLVLLLIGGALLLLLLGIGGVGAFLLFNKKADKGPNDHVDVSYDEISLPDYELSYWVDESDAESVEIEPEVSEEEDDGILYIKFRKGPDKTVYTVGESFDLEGLELYAFYENNERVLITEGVTYEPKVFTESGRITVKLSYKGHISELFVTVKEEEERNYKYTGTWGDLDWGIDYDGVLVISGDGYMNDLSWYESLAWAEYKDEITYVIVEEGVLSIGDYAFSEHERLLDVTLPKSVSKLGLNSFRGCISIERQFLPDSVNEIEEDAFAFCTSLKEINIPSGVGSIEKWLFGYCTSLERIEYDGTVEEWRALPKGLNWFKDTQNFNVVCTDGEISHTINGSYTLAYSAYTVTLTDNGDGTATITAAVPAGVQTGALVISTSNDLELINGSLKSVSGAICNENYGAGISSGAYVSFASVNALANGQIVFEAEYRIASGASLDFSDFSAPLWSLGSNGAFIGNNGSGPVLEKLVK